MHSFFSIVHFFSFSSKYCAVLLKTNLMKQHSSVCYATETHSLVQENILSHFCVWSEKNLDVFAFMLILSTCKVRRFKYVASRWLTWKLKLFRILQKINSFLYSPIKKNFFQVYWDHALFSHFERRLCVFFSFIVFERPDILYKNETWFIEQKDRRKHYWCLGEKERGQT